MLTKDSKIKILENFYSIDYALLGKPVSEIGICCPFFLEEYLSIKGALMSVVKEMYQIIDHSPKPICEGKVTRKILKESAIMSARNARSEAKKLVSSQMGRESVKKRVSESLKSGEGLNVDQVVQENIRRKAFSLSIDSILIGSAVTESENPTSLNSWNGKILEDAYKILRDQLVESASSILENAESR